MRTTKGLEWRGRYFTHAFPEKGRGRQVALCGTYPHELDREKHRADNPCPFCLSRVGAFLRGEVEVGQ